MRTLLISPPWHALMNRKRHDIHLGLASITGVLRAEGHDVLMLDGESALFSLLPEGSAPTDLFSHDTGVYVERQDSSHPIWDKFAKVVLSYSPDIVGITSWSGAYQSCVNVCKALKKLSPDIIIVIGGVHATLVPEDFIKLPEVDFVIKGEGEGAAKALWPMLQNRTDRNILNIPGVWTNVDGNIHCGGMAEMIADLDDLPFPSYDTLIGEPPSDWVPGIATSRGCPFRCGFCSSEALWSSHVRFRSPESCINELKEYDRKFGLKSFRINDDSFCLRKSRVLEFCDLLVETFGEQKLKFWADANVNTVDDDIISALEIAGCDTLSIGVESVAPRIRKEFIRKKVDLDQVRWLMNRLEKSKINGAAYFLTGWPHETEEELRMTIDFMKEVRPRYSEWGVITSYPGTELYKYACENNILPEVESYYSMHHSLKTSMAEIPYERHKELLEEIQEFCDQQGISRKSTADIWRYRLSHPINSIMGIYRRFYSIFESKKETL